MHNVSSRRGSSLVAFAVVFATVLPNALGSVACSSSDARPNLAGDATVDQDATVSDATGVDASFDSAPLDAGSKAARCATSFGDALTAPFGRIDGTLLAVVKPDDQQCTLPNRTHITLQVLAGGKVYRMVTNVQSDRAGVSPDVRFFATTHALPAPAWAEGWHGGIAFDYVHTLDVHNTSFTPLAKDALVKTVDDAVTLDAKISVYASTDGGASAHLIHRNVENADGAIVLNPESATPKFLLFHFDQQQF